MNKSILTVFALFLLQLFAQPAHANDSDAVIKYGKIFQISNFLNVHSSPQYWLQIGNKRFSNVAGVAPFYVSIDDIEAVFFVTNPWDEKMTGHIFFLRDKRDVEFSIYYEGFYSYQLGQPSSARGAVIVEKVALPIIIIRSKIDLMSDLFEFNVQTGKCSKIKK